MAIHSTTGSLIHADETAVSFLLKAINSERLSPETEVGISNIPSMELPLDLQLPLTLDWDYCTQIRRAEQSSEQLHLYSNEKCSTSIAYIQARLQGTDTQCISYVNDTGLSSTTLQISPTGLVLHLYFWYRHCGRIQDLVVSLVFDGCRASRRKAIVRREHSNCETAIPDLTTRLQIQDWVNNCNFWMV